LDFPEQTNMPLLYKVDKKNHTGNSDYYFGPWQHLYRVDIDDYIALKDKIVYIFNELIDERFEVLDFSKLGKNYTLARGATNSCIALTAPVGFNGMLNHRARDDCEKFERLVKLRLAERQTFFDEILMEKTLEDLKKLSRK
jgi:hypothetical protein